MCCQASLWSLGIISYVSSVCAGVADLHAFFAIFFKSALVNLSAHSFPTKPPLVYDVFWIALFEAAMSASVTDSQNLLFRLLSKLFLKDKNHSHWHKYNLWVQSSIWFYMYTSINNQSYFFYFIYSVFYY